MVGDKCPCIALDCPHRQAYGAQCGQPMDPKGGICADCRYYSPPKRCPSCGQTLPKGEDIGD